MRQRLERALGTERVISDPEVLRTYDDDYSEAERITPSLVVLPATVEEVREVVRAAAATGTPLTPRVAGTNVAGLAIPAPGGVVVDLRSMNRIVSVDVDNMVAVIEPGVTQEQMRAYLEAHDIPLTLGYSLGPRRSSILANCLLDGLTNRSLKYGTMGEWVAGLEVVLADATVVRTGAWALSDVPFARSPFPDLTGMFVGWQGTTGIATKVAIHLVPQHPLRQQLFVMAYSARGAYGVMRRLCRLETCDDIGALSWPTAKMMLGVPRPFLVPSPGEPTFFLVVDFAGETHEEMAVKRDAVTGVIERLREQGERFEEPIDVSTLVLLNPAMGKFAELPADLDLLTEHPGGGLTWVGTYGPMSRIDVAADHGSEIMIGCGFPPAIVSRAMKGGHFGVLRFLMLFDRHDPAELQRVKETNAELLRSMTVRGFVMYKTPAWALARLLPAMNPGHGELMRRLKAVLDPNGILNPGKLMLP